MKKVLFITTMICQLATACGDLFGTQHSIEGTWGMVSGGIKKNGSFKSLDQKADFYKTIEFKSDGTFVETCGSYTATGTYNASCIKYDSATVIQAPGLATASLVSSLKYSLNNIKDISSP